MADDVSIQIRAEIAQAQANLKSFNNTVKELSDLVARGVGGDIMRRELDDASLAAGRAAAQLKELQDSLKGTSVEDAKAAKAAQDNAKALLAQAVATSKLYKETEQLNRAEKVAAADRTSKSFQGTTRAGQGPTSSLSGAAFGGYLQALQQSKLAGIEAAEITAAFGGELDKVGKKLNGVGGEAKRAGAGLGFYVREGHAITDEALAGRFGQMQGTLANVTITALQSAGAFSAAKIGLVAFVGEVAIAVGYLGYLSAKIFEFKEQTQSLFRQSAAAGNNSTLAAIKTLQEGFAGIPDATSEASAAISSVAVKIGDTSGVIALAIEKSIQPLAEISGTDIPTAMANMSAAMDKPFTAGKALAESFGALSLAESQALDTAQQSGDADEARSVILGHLAAAFKRTEDAIKGTSAETTTFGERMLAAASQFFRFGTFAQVGAAATHDFGRALTSASTLLEQAAKSAQDLSSRLKNVIADANNLTIKENTLPQQLQESIDKVEKLQQGLKAISSGGIGAAGGATGGTADATALIKQFEGFQPTAKYDVNAYRAGYGSDTTTDETGKVHAVVADTVTTIVDAQRDLARRVVEFTNQAAKDVGPEWAKLSDQAKASLTSIAYNYGHLPANIAAAARTGDSGQISSSILSHQGDNGGINADRRAAEAANVSSQGTMNAAVGDELDKQQKIRESIKDQADARSGGTAIEQAQLAILEARAAGNINEVKAARDMVEADQKELAALKDIGATDQNSAKFRTAKLKLLQDEAALTEKVTAAKKASFDLEDARSTKGSKEELNAKLGAVNVEQAPYANDPNGAKFQEFEAQKLQIQDAYDKQQTANQAEEENVRWNAEKKSLETSIDNVKAAVQEKTISFSKGAQEIIDLYKKEEAADTAHYGKLSSLYTDDLTKFREYSQKKAEVDAEYAKKIADEQAKATEKVAAQYQQVFGSVTSTVATAFTGIITQHQKLRDAVRNVLDSIIGMFAQAVAKIVANWLAQMALLALPGGIGGIATLALGAIGLPAFASGSWELPNDMIAQVHKGEMIIPAAQAGAIRSGSSAVGGAGGAAGGGGVHHHTHFNVSAMDSRSVHQFFKEHGKAIAKSLNESVRTGGHLGLSRLGR